MARIPLTRGAFAEVDEEDFQRLSAISWKLLNTGYAGSTRHGLMHHQVGPRPTKGLHRDHIDGDKLNNRRSNLRDVSPSQNGLNRGAARKDSGTGALGVGLHRASGLYQARLQGRSLGYFKTIPEAEVAYWAAKVELCG